MHIVSLCLTVNIIRVTFHVHVCVPVVVTTQLSPETTPGSGYSLQEEAPLIIENELLRESSCTDFTAVAKLGMCMRAFL